jgi:preprotein translocase subunit SecG
MDPITIILLVLFVIIAILMMLVVLLQDDQGEGIGGMFGGAGTTPLGSRSGNVLTRFTSILGGLFLFGAFALAWMNRTPEAANLAVKARMEQLQQSQATDWWVQKPAAPAAAQEPLTPQAAAPQSAAPSQAADQTRTTAPSTAPAGGEAPSGLQR